MMNKGSIGKESTRRRRSYFRGIAAEYACIAWLVLKGYAILALRHRNPFGEIDIIASRGGIVAFIEVKARATHDDAAHSITPLKQERVARAASAFLARNQKYAQHGLRFDVMMVTSRFRINHLRDAWRT